MTTENMPVATLPEDERERLEPYLEPTDMMFEQILIEVDVPIDYMYFPRDAVTSTLQLLRNGNTVEAGLMGLEGMVGLQFWLHQRTTPSRTLVQVPGKGLRMRSDVFEREVMNKPSPLNRLIAQYIHAFLNLTAQTAACNRMHEIDERLCRWLRRVYNRVPE